MLAENERKGGYYPSRLPSFLGFAVRPLGCLKALPSVLLVSPLRGYAASAQPPGSRRERPAMSQLRKFNYEEASAILLARAHSARRPKRLLAWVQNLLAASLHHYQLQLTKVQKPAVLLLTKATTIAYTKRTL